ncbi:hypothetical protein OPT61_g3947 [Boeremia exigua]|uniref:Uncharacterized protein n=1 Tax=Boeremia exigua TaxID=749465 RepID=A0ACC2IFY7_9PLEO|nr:hypothetical protein OPT61_g3947 [Boeremia exigua]
MRNKIYDFATHATNAGRCCVVPCLALAQSCRQIRCEYRPLCLKADVAIDWKDVSSYLNTFFPSHNGEVANIKLAPGRITVFTNTYRKRGLVKAAHEIDLLPILKFGLDNKEFACKFAERKIEGGCVENYGGLTQEELQILREADVNTIQTLLAHRNPEWVEDITKGRIRKLMASQLGTNEFPVANFHIGLGEDNCVPPEFAKISQQNEPRRHEPESDNSEIDDYLSRVGLRAVFESNPYDFLWEYEWTPGKCNPGNTSSASPENTEHHSDSKTV